MAKMSEKQLIVVTLVLTLIPTAGFLYMAWTDYGEWKKLDDAIKTDRLEIQRLNLDIGKIESIKAELDQKAALFEEHVKILPSQAELDDLARQIQHNLGLVGIPAMDTLRPVSRPPGRGGSFTTYTYNMSFVADYKQFIRFVRMIEENKRFITVEEFSLMPRQGEVDRLTINTQLQTYVYTGTIDNTIYTPRKPKDGTAPTEPVEEPDAWQFEVKNTWRNPFESVLEERQPEPTGPTDPGDQAERAKPPSQADDQEEQDARIVHLWRKLRVLQNAFRDNQYAILLQLLDDYQNELDETKITIPELRERLAMLTEQYQGIRKRVLQDAEFIRAWAELRLDSIKENFELATQSMKQEHYQRVVDEYDLVEQKFKQFAGLVSGDIESESIRGQAQELAQRAKHRIEFMKLPLMVKGIIHLRDPSQTLRSQAIVEYDKKTYDLDAVELNSIDLNPDLTLERVDDEGAVFNYKGEKIQKAVEEPVIGGGGVTAGQRR